MSDLTKPEPGTNLYWDDCPGCGGPIQIKMGSVYPHYTCTTCRDHQRYGRERMNKVFKIWRNENEQNAKQNEGGQDQEPADEPRSIDNEPDQSSRSIDSEPNGCGGGGPSDADHDDEPSGPLAAIFGR